MQTLENRRGMGGRWARSFGRALVALAALFLWVDSGLAAPSPAARLGASYKVLSRGNLSAIEITLKPTVDFATVTVEPVSGVALLSAPCFLQDLGPDRSEVCVTQVAGDTKDRVLTIKVVGHRPISAGTPAVEISRFTMPNPSFVAAADKASKSSQPTGSEGKKG
jgi:hypothetical protein